MKTLRVVLFLALTGCTSASKMPVRPEMQRNAEEPAAEVVLGAEVLESLPEGSWRYKITEAAKSEWQYFGQQLVVIDGYDESIPHVGIWEDEDDSHSDRINQYWRAVGKSRLSGYDCKQPWSAAFISWIMQTVGVSKSLFPPSGAHWVYLHHFLANANNPDAVFIPHTIEQYKPKPGDLICAVRSNYTPTDVIRELPVSLISSRLHCDIVVESNGETLQVIGGNVRNSVSKTILTLSQDGYVQSTSRRPWFLIIENRLDY
ncbi:MAG: DUF2272 domain-containing protein [Candidatus Dechloromonas phosphoritropha]